MVLELAQRTEPRISKRAAISSSDNVHEIAAFCPGCKTFETLWFKNSSLMGTRKFIQVDDHIFHDCGVQEPCRLYRIW